jgi:hypothetical protein
MIGDETRDSGSESHALAVALAAAREHELM